ncbi:undecaprenyl-phosphate glucose phosphotransferase [Ferrimonas balearica]|uniref:undecaprenyl-phosphate glucose phosphotransferase n=1 Tax=Ferrimonas balearica TaxID=44012 RepID=UPI001C93E777|nr:undecaprenyl-phosphate glucose phosphotransferase [Ferrimonas balearica]MBY6225138.1 undecaprenyl-phosphate glucose phosphotransferase [Ferrimonas balearica]
MNIKEQSWFSPVLHRIGDVSGLLMATYTSFKLIPENQSSVLLLLMLSALVSGWFFSTVGVYRPWRGNSKINELTLVLTAWLGSWCILAIAYYCIPFISLEVDLLIAYLVAGIIWLTTSRILVRLYLNKVRSQGGNTRKVVVIGEGISAKRLLSKIRGNAWIGYDVAGQFGKHSVDDDYQYLGDESEVCKYLSEHPRVREVWVAMSLAQEERVVKVLQRLDATTCNVRYIPDPIGFRLINHSITPIAGINALNLSMSPMDSSNRVLKAVEDRIIAAIILLMISPLMILLAIGVKLSSPGPVFYRQERVSWNGKTFGMLKFRSMTVDSEASGVQWGGAATMSVTKFGRFIRATSLDELPQFINVLLGDMSIVGPRPERPMFVDQFKHEIPGYMRKHKVKAGITGLAQINGWRGDTDLSKRIECDLDYIDNWSLWLDLKIIFLTIFRGFVHKNAK